MYQNTIGKFNAIAFTIIMVLCAVLPFFFLPATLGGLGSIKGVLLYGAVFLAFSFWLIAQFLEGTLRVPKHRALLVLGVWMILALVSALFSKNVSVSLWGRGFVVDSFATVLVLTLFTFMIASFARDQKKLVKLFLSAFAGSVLTVLLQVILYVTQRVPFVAKYLAHVSNQGTLVGSWVDFAHFVIFTFLISLLMYEVLAPKGFFKFLSLFSMILSIIVLVFLNFKAAWIITIASALLVFVYKSSVERSISGMIPPTENEVEQESLPKAEDNSLHMQHFPYMSFVSLLVGLFFLLSSGSVGASIANFAGVSFNDIRPSFTTTTHVLRATLAHNPVFGAGAGRYADVWKLYHPVTINQTVFWNTPFDTGYSLYQSLLTTNGILVILALTVALGITVVHGFKLFGYKFPDRFSRFIAVTALIMLIAFVCLIVLASPGIVLITYGFMYMGLLLGVSTLVGKTKIISLNYLRDPRLSFFAILVLVVSAMAGFSAVYFSGNRFASIVTYNHALAASDIPTAEKRIDRALSLSENDIYWRTRTQLYTKQFTSLAGTQSPDKAQLQAVFSQAEQSARAAVTWDPGSSDNWLALSQVYQLVSNSQNADGYTNSKQAADEAQKRSPNNPVYLLNQAQLAMTKQDSQGAFNYIDQALALKADYLDAFILKSQIESAAGDTQAAVTEITAYTKVAPFDSQGYDYLGQAELGVKDYQAALDAFSQARQLAPTDANIYLEYIGVLELMGNKTQAIAELNNFKKLYPNVQGVDQEIDRVQNGTAVPVSTATAPTTTTVPPTTATKVSPKKK